MSKESPEAGGIRLTPAMQQAIDSAFGIGKPVALAYVDEQNAPQISYRGSTQAFGDSELAIWVRNPSGRLLPSIARNPAVALIFGDFNPQGRRFLILRGRARVDDSETVREQVYGRAHEFERSQDPERKGIAVIVRLDSVEGFFDGARVAMHRQSRGGMP